MPFFRKEWNSIKVVPRLCQCSYYQPQNNGFVRIGLIFEWLNVKIENKTYTPTGSSISFGTPRYVEMWLICPIFGAIMWHTHSYPIFSQFSMGENWVWVRMSQNCPQNWTYKSHFYIPRRSKRYGGPCTLVMKRVYDNTYLILLLKNLWYILLV